MSCLIKQMNDFIKTPILAKFAFLLIHLFKNTDDTFVAFSDLHSKISAKHLNYMC